MSIDTNHHGAGLPPEIQANIAAEQAALHRRAQDAHVHAASMRSRWQDWADRLRELTDAMPGIAPVNSPADFHAKVSLHLEHLSREVMRNRLARIVSDADAVTAAYRRAERHCKRALDGGTS